MQQSRGHQRVRRSRLGGERGRLQRVVELGDLLVVRIATPPLVQGQHVVDARRHRTGRPWKSPISETGTRSPARGCAGQLGRLLAVVVGAQVALGQCVVGRVQRPPGPQRPVRAAAMGRARVEPERVTGLDRHGTPPHRGHDIGPDAPRVVGRPQPIVRPGDHLEAAVLLGGGVDRHHARHVDVDEAVRRRVLVRGVPGAAGQLVVELVLVEHRRLAQQRARGGEQVARAQQRPQARVVGHQVLAAAQRRAVVGQLAVVEPAAPVGPRRHLVGPRLQPGGQRRRRPADGRAPTRSGRSGRRPRPRCRRRTPGTRPRPDSSGARVWQAPDGHVHPVGRDFSVEPVESGDPARRPCGTSTDTAKEANHEVHDDAPPSRGRRSPGGHARVRRRDGGLGRPQRRAHGVGQPRSPPPASSPRPRPRRCARRTARRSSPTARSPRPRSCCSASTSSTFPTSTPPPPWRPGCPTRPYGSVEVRPLSFVEQG